MSFDYDLFVIGGGSAGSVLGSGLSSIWTIFMPSASATSFSCGGRFTKRLVTL